MPKNEYIIDNLKELILHMQGHTFYLNELYIQSVNSKQMPPMNKDRMSDMRGHIQYLEKLYKINNIN
jgi:hypothetical protein